MHFLTYFEYQKEDEASTFPICLSTHYYLSSAPRTNQGWGRLVFKWSKSLGVFVEAITLKLKFHWKKPTDIELFIFHFCRLKYELIFYSASLIFLINSCPVVLMTFTNQLSTTHQSLHRALMFYCSCTGSNDFSLPLLIFLIKSNLQHSSPRWAFANSKYIIYVFSATWSNQKIDLHAFLALSQAILGNK